MSDKTWTNKSVVAAALGDHNFKSINPLAHSLRTRPVFEKVWAKFYFKSACCCAMRKTKRWIKSGGDLRRLETFGWVAQWRFHYFIGSSASLNLMCWSSGTQDSFYSRCSGFNWGRADMINKKLMTLRRS